MYLIKKDERVFTLVELIVVLALLFVLAAIGIVRYSGITDKSRLETDYYTATLIA